MVRVTNWIGDAVMNTPALGGIRKAFPDAEIVVVANPLVAQLFEPHSCCDRVLVFDKNGPHRGLLGMLRFAARLRRERFDVAILFQKAIEAAIMAALAGIPKRLGYSTDTRGLLLTDKLKFTPEIIQQHQTRHYLHLLQLLGIAIPVDEPQCLCCSEEELSWADQQLGEGTWLAINPGAAYGSAKRWLPERFSQVADSLAQTNDFNVLLIGGSNERDLGREIEETMQREALNMVGATSVRQMVALLSRCTLMITNDSGPMHVGAALGVPIVAIFGSTDHTTTYPYGVRHKIVRKDFDCAPCLKRICPIDHRCMRAVEAADVITAAQQLLAEI
jgi:heptosyltransferase-2